MSQIIDVSHRRVVRERTFTLRIPYGREALKLYACVAAAGLSWFAYQSAISRFGSLTVHAALLVGVLFALSILIREINHRNSGPSLANQEKVLWARMNDPRASATSVSSLAKQLERTQALLEANNK